MAKKTKAGSRRKAAKLMTKAGTTAGATQRTMLVHRDQEGPTDPALIIDGPGLLSLRNHRLYRQGRVYRQRLKASTRSANYNLDHIEVYALRNTWMLRKAYKMAQSVYMEATKEERAGFSKDQLRWLDFKVNVNPGPWSTVARLLNTKFAFATGAITYTTQLPLAEDSRVQDADGNNKYFALSGGTSSAQWNILEEYNRYAETPSALSVASTGNPYGNILNSADAATAAFVQEDGADAPYDMTNIDLDIWEHVGTLHIDSTSGEQTLVTPYVDCPLGVMLLVGSSPDLPSVNDIHFTLEFAPGDYKGVASDAI